MMSPGKYIAQLLGLIEAELNAFIRNVHSDEVCASDCRVGFRLIIFGKPHRPFNQPLTEAEKCVADTYARNFTKRDYARAHNRLLRKQQEVTR